MRGLGKYEGIYREILAAEKAIMGYNLVEIHNCITTDDFDVMKEKLKGFGYNYFINEKRAYKELNDIGKKDEAIEIRYRNGLYKATVITYGKRY